MQTDRSVPMLELLQLLGGEEYLSASEIGQRMGFSDRQARSYIELLRRNGFTVVEKSHRYRIDYRSPFYQLLRQRAVLTESEAEMVCRILSTVDESNETAASARRKLARYYGIEALESAEVRRKRNTFLDVFNEAMARKRMVMIRGYSSPHSRSVSDRIVEPFLLMNGGMDVRCHELRSHQNKTFRLSRMAGVELLDVPWIAETEHRKVYTDLFMFSGEEVHHVKVLMGQLSHSLMLEEYPRSERCFTPCGDSRWLLETDVVSFLGVGRFVMGLCDDVEVLGDEAFLAYISDKKAKMAE